MTKQGNKKTVLITGSGGLLGTELIEQLLDCGNWQVIAMTSNVNNVVNKFNNDKLLVVSNDSWIEQLSNRNIKVDTLINCAFPRTSKPEELAQGIPFTERLITDSINFGIENIINISSQSVYTQKQKEDVTEKSAVQPESLYGMTKYACERVVSILCETNDVNYSNIRLGSLVSIELTSRMTNRFIENALNNKKITIDKNNIDISYLHVKDAANALVFMINKFDKKWKNIYNLGTFEKYSLNELTSLINKYLREKNESFLEYNLKDNTNSYNNFIDSSIFYKEFDWKPSITITQIIDDIYISMKE